MKVIALGFAMHKDSYLRDGWNCLDGTIVILSLVGLMLPNATGFRALRVLRLCRVLRVLRLVSHNEGLQLVVEALLASIPGVINVLMVVVMFFLIFADHDERHEENDVALLVVLYRLHVHSALVYACEH